MTYAKYLNIWCHRTNIMHKTTASRSLRWIRENIKKLEDEIELLREIKGTESLIKEREQKIEKLRNQIDDKLLDVRIQDTQVWVMRKIKKNRVYEYWMASWRENGKVMNIYLGSRRRLNYENALQKARKIKYWRLRP